jgi:DNA phosphorothioation-dependent restriction protein DptG
LIKLLDSLKEIRELFKDCLKYVKDKKDSNFQDVAAKDLVEMYGYIYVGFLLLNEADYSRQKVFTARRYIFDSLAKSRKNTESIKNELYSDVLHADTILI